MIIWSQRPAGVACRGSESALGGHLVFELAATGGNAVAILVPESLERP
jgi:hypothetical protein